MRGRSRIGTWVLLLFNDANLDYVATAELIQTVDGRPFADAVRERVLVPMNMTATFDGAVALAGDHATAYGDGLAYQLGQDPVNRPMFQTFGGLMGSVTDLAHFVLGRDRHSRGLIRPRRGSGEQVADGGFELRDVVGPVAVDLTR